MSVAREGTTMTITQLNSLSRDEFVRIVGPVFEHSPWIAEAAWLKRPFASVEELHSALGAVVRAAGEEKQLALIRAHPDLVGRAAPANALTPESTREQASAGLGALTPAEIAAFQTSNAAYREKFGFPFVICARLNKKDAILHGFRVRLSNSREQEIETAREEIFKIAWLRLQDTITETAR
jgi:2-oxo-4-hydroxy-4-carboxy-5-ureidoimidazoline decarboxylase